MKKRTENNRSFSWERVLLRIYKVIYFLCLIAVVVSAWLKMQEHYNADGKTTIVLTAIHILCLAPLLSVYRALEVEKKRSVDLCIGQMLSIVISDAITFLSASLVLKGLPRIEISIVTLLLQIFLCVIWTLSATALVKRWIPAQKVAVLYSDEKAYESIGELHLDSDSFDVVQTICIDGYEENGKSITDTLSGISGVFLCGIPTQLRNEIMTELIKRDITVYIRPKNSDIFLNTAQRRYMLHIPMLAYDPKKHSLLTRVTKRTMDILFSLPIFIITSPIMLITAIAIKCEDSGPVLYKQERLTRGGRVFKILKFRSMRVDAEKDGVARLASEGDDRITKVGRFIRATRIDELPQLINILRGDMSLVGPRPERPEIASQYEKELPEFSMRLKVKAGLTGYAQIYGKYNTTPYDKLQMDLLYINDMSPITDFKLLLQTAQTVFQKESTEGVKKGQITAKNDKK